MWIIELGVLVGFCTSICVRGHGGRVATLSPPTSALATTHYDMTCTVLKPQINEINKCTSISTLIYPFPSFSPWCRPLLCPRLMITVLCFFVLVQLEFVFRWRLSAIKILLELEFPQTAPAILYFYLPYLPSTFDLEFST